MSVIHETLRAFNLADRFMQPVFVLLDETIGHMSGKLCPI